MSSAFLHGLESAFAWVLEASWQASVLAALVLLLQGAFRGRLNPRWHHALWLLVVARLLLPVLPESALSLFQFAPATPPAVEQTMTEPIFAASRVMPVVTAVTTPAPPPQYPFSAFTVLALIWLAGASGLLLLTWAVNRRFALHVSSAPGVTDPRLLQLAEAARQELGIRRNLRIIESAQVQSPAIMGLFRPTLILPTEVRARFSDEELRFIFLHEFAHLKRGDLFLQWLIALLQVVHWFNPVLWYAFRRIRIDREPATDALVLSRTGEEQKEPYGQVLMKLLEHYHTRHALPTLVGILEDKDQFKRRFLLITRFTRSAYAWSLLGMVLIVALTLSCLTKARAAVSDAHSPAESNSQQRFVRFDVIAVKESAYQARRAEFQAVLQNGSLDKLLAFDTVKNFGRHEVHVVAGKESIVATGEAVANVDYGKPLLQIKCMTGPISPQVFNLEGTFVIDEVRPPTVDEEARLKAGDAVRPTIDTTQAKFSTNLPIGQEQSILSDGLLGPTTNASGAFRYFILATALDPAIGKAGPVTPGGIQGANASKKIVSTNAGETGKKDAVKLAFTLVEVDDKTYEKQAVAMDAALAKGDLEFFSQQKDVFVGPAIKAAYSGSKGWYSVGEAQSAVGSVVYDKRDGKPWTTLNAVAFFFGVNADFVFYPSPSGTSMDSLWKVDEPESAHGQNAPPLETLKIFPKTFFVGPVVHTAKFEDKGWIITPGKPHAFWLGQTLGQITRTRQFSDLSHASIDEMAKGKIPSRIAVFITAEDGDSAQKQTSGSLNESPASLANSDAGDESYFYDTLKRDRTLIADSRVHASTLEADVEMLLAIQKGDVAALKKVLEHAVDPNTFDPDRFASSPVYWAVHFNQPECLKLLLDHFAGDDGPTHRVDQSALALARASHLDLVPILEEGLKRNQVTLTARLKEQLHSIRIDLPAFSHVPLSKLVHFLIEATAKAGYLERRVGVGNLDVPPTTTITSPAASNVTIWEALQKITSANNLRFDVTAKRVGTIMLYPPAAENIVHPPSGLATGGADIK